MPASMPVRPYNSTARSVETWAYRWQEMYYGRCRADWSRPPVPRSPRPNCGHRRSFRLGDDTGLFAFSPARLLRLSKYGLEPVTVRETDHYKVMREFCEDPDGFVQAAIEE